MLPYASAVFFLAISIKAYNISFTQNLDNATKVSQNITSDVQTCGGIYNKLQFIIETPNYPSNYPNNLNCLFIFKGPYCESNYTLQFLDYNVEDSLGCANDRLEIKDKDALCGTHDGIKTYVSSTGTLVLNFISDAMNSARGFRILVSRSICYTETAKTNTITTTPSNVIPVTETTTQVSVYNYITYPPAGFRPNSKVPACCAGTYNTKQFYISSPGFPQLNNRQECQFTIFRANNKICRIRIHLKYFWVGVSDAACTEGYLQIDGKLICGCHTGMKLVLPFDGSFGNTKVFRFKSAGLPTNSAYAGFAIEVIQDDCPKRYIPENDNMNVKSIRRLRSLVSEIYKPVDLTFKPNVVKHVYFFDSPDNMDVNAFNRRRDVEETTYLDISDFNSLYTSGTSTDKCYTWSIADWKQLVADPLWGKMIRCHQIDHNIQNTQCKEFNLIKGSFQSPGYPYYYPKNSNICYRFLKQRGYCKIRLVMQDFHVESSFDCTKDYLKLNGGFRYCGQSLANTFTLFDMSGKAYEEIKFVTDSQNNGRGFRGIYEQIPCYHTAFPEISLTTPTPPIIPSAASCSRFICDSYFTIDVYDYGSEICKFIINRSSEDICQLDLTLITFDFPCGKEFLLINNRRYCGDLAGRTLSLDFVEGSVELIYNKVSPEEQKGLKLHLSGRQIENCGQLPPAQRLLLQADSVGNIDLVPDKSDEISITLRKNLKDVCGVVMNLKSSNTSESFCNYILNKSEVLDCNHITPRTIYVPYNGIDELEIKFRNAGRDNM